MTAQDHHYTVTIEWTGNRGSGTSHYRAYGRDHEIRGRGDKPAIPGSADPAFRGDPARWNPEELLLASLAACHKLWYLHLCAVSDITVLAYCDEASGIMTEDASGSGAFSAVTLHPHVTITPESDPALAARLHQDAHEKCFIANSVTFPVTCAPVIVTA